MKSLTPSILKILVILADTLQSLEGHVFRAFLEQPVHAGQPQP